MSENRYIYRKEIAVLVQCTVRAVANNEDRWGIRKFRRDLNCRHVRYLRESVIGALTKVGMI